ncbi:thiamine phosphate synthase [Marinilabiliaceae bacterium JC017]|nr:thiamine phosphate synthase [Marinilabiliaceae bacterium JC017]
MQKQIAKLHFITTYNPGKSHLDQVREYCAGGGNWVQLRMKEATAGEVEVMARKCLSVCMDFQAKLIINDHVDVAAKVGADGVHLGKNDMSPAEARQIQGDHMIIGGTANTFEDIQRLVSQGVDYIGLGPYRFTTTKKNLSPVLGLEGYQAIIKQCSEAGISIPVVAIGGLGPDDLKGLFTAGVHGVAISSYLVNQEQMGIATIQLLEQIGRHSSANWMKTK